MEEKEDTAVVRRGRGRRKVVKILSLPETISESLTAAQKDELNHAYTILDKIIRSTAAQPFQERPDDSTSGLEDYFKVITKPMWLNEVSRKLHDGQYLSLFEFVVDVRQILENCYRFWGRSHKLTNKGIKLERVLEQKLADLPTELCKKCSLSMTHGKMDAESEVNGEVERDDAVEGMKTPAKKKGLFSGSFVSELLEFVEREGMQMQEAREARLTERELMEKEVTDWENITLFPFDERDYVNSMWELPQLGHFLYLTHRVLNIEQIPQTELERMLLIPQESTCLATVMTSMLVSPLSRLKLDSGPPMPYHMWTAKLATRVAHWYKLYHARESVVEAFSELGIEPQFWLVLGDFNPLEDYAFHELSFLQRVWLLKGLIDFVVCNHKRIQEALENANEEDLYETILGTDVKGSRYLYFPMFSETRLYRQAKIPDKNWQVFSDGVEEVISKLCEEIDEEEDPISKDEALLRRPLHRPPRCVVPSSIHFELIASSVEDVRCLVDELCEADVQLLKGRGRNASLLASLNSVITDRETSEAKTTVITSNARSKLYKEWVAVRERPESFVDPAVAYWEKHAEESRTQDTNGSATIDTVAVEGEGRGERRVKREGVLQRLVDREIDGSEDESEEEYGEDSEDEWKLSQPKKKKKYLCISPRRRKKLDAMVESMNAENDEKEKLKITGNHKKRLNRIKKENREREDMCNVVKQAKLESVENNLKIDATIKHSIVKTEVKSEVKCEKICEKMIKAVQEVKQPLEIFNIALVKKELTEKVKSKLPAQIEIKTFAKFNPSESIKHEILNSSINSKPIQANRYLSVREPDVLQPQYQTQLQGAGGPSHSLYHVPYSSASSVVVQQHLSSPQNIAPLQSNQQSEYYVVRQPNEASISNQLQRCQMVVVGSQSSSSCMVRNGVAQTPSEKNVLIRTVMPQIIKSSPHLTPPPQVTKCKLTTLPEFRQFHLASPPQVRQPQSQTTQTASSFNVRTSSMVTSPAKRQTCLTSPTQIGLPRTSPSLVRSSRLTSPPYVRTSRLTSPSQVGMSRLTTAHSCSPHQQHQANGSHTPLSCRSQVTVTPTRTLNNKTIRPSVARTLFNSPQKPKSVERNSSCFVDARMVKLGSSPDGSFSYTVTLPDGTVKSLSSQEIGRIREQNGGYIPREGTICVQLKTPQVYDDIIIID